MSEITPALFCLSLVFAFNFVPLYCFKVTQLPGKNSNPGMQVLVQGNQVAIVARFLLGK